MTAPDIEREISFPGFVDVHVHFRDPGMTEAETIETGLAAARHGGMRAVVMMPNTNPPIDSPELVRTLLSRRGGDETSPLLLTSAAITRGRAGESVADLEHLADAGAVFFTDDGTYVSNQKVLEEAMRRAAKIDRVVSQHALSPGLTEADCIRRDLSVCRVTGCRYHVQHISTAEGVELVRAAKAEGLPVTAEATPHHVLLIRDDIPSSPDPHPPTYFKMAPPLATREDREAVRQAVKEGFLMFATDHAPHPDARKLCAYEKAANGIIGLETALAVTHHVMVEEEGMAETAWAEAWWKMPREILPREISIPGETRVAFLRDPATVDPATFKSKSRNCPYGGMRFKLIPIGG